MNNQFGIAENKLFEKFQKQNEELKEKPMNQKNLDIKAIEFDWIFDKHNGSEFIRTLSNTTNIELFSLKIVKYIIQFLWSQFQNAIIIYLFIPFLLYFSIFVIYATWVHKRKTEENDENGLFHLANFILVIILLVLQLYFTYFKIRQIGYQKLSFFKIFWNIIDMISIPLDYGVLIFDLIDFKEETITTLTGISVLLIWLRLFYFGRIFLQTAALIRMIAQIIIDMRYFLLLLLISIAAFSNGFFILARNTEGDMFTGNNMFRSFLYSYRQALGDFDTDGFDQDDKEYIRFLWFGNTMITLIVLLNMLIAIMGDTFDKVQESSENNMLKEIASLMVENELLINRTKTFGDAKYIIVIEEEQADESEINWSGRLNHIRKFMKTNTDHQSKLLKDFERIVRKEILDKTERRGKQLENSVNKHFNNLFEKCEIIEEKLKNTQTQISELYKIE